MKFIIIDDNAASRDRLKELLREGWPEIDFEDWDPVHRDLPDERFDWKPYDVLLLDYDLKVANGLDWFEKVHNRANFPPTIILSRRADPDVAVRAIKAGAENYAPKRGLTARRLNEIVAEILDNPPARVPRGSIDNGARRTGRVIHMNRRGGGRVGWPEIEGHTVKKKIGQGGMSTIYLAERHSDGREVVVKTLLTSLVENKKSVLRTRQEFQLISRIHNPHIVSLYEHGTVGDFLYTTMEYFPKGDLKQRLRRGMLQQHALKYLHQIAEGLNAIHGCGVIHRDLKPGNIMFRDDESLAIIDFGISKDINSTLDLTEHGQIMGTPNYMAPEQGKGPYKPDARSDIYSLGVMLYEMLTGNKPYAAPTGAAIIYKHLHDPIPQLPNRFYDMQVLIDRMMAKFPHQRFQSAYDLLQFIDSEYRLDLMMDFDD